jgi:hypothetical protein
MDSSELRNKPSSYQFPPGEGNLTRYLIFQRLSRRTLYKRDFFSCLRENILLEQEG